MIGEAELMLNVQKLKEIIPEREWRYYYLQSVENFIYHLKSFKNERTKERMASDIEKYVKIVYEKLNEASYPQDKARELLPLVWKISNTYKDELGFTRRPTYLGIVLLLIPLFFLLKTSYSFSTSLSICVFAFATYTVYSYIKVKKRKVY
ncbi:hypothetical protein HRG84_03040 [Flavisolibacter sp. BT320]|nr:hypothetical protein [Flavisolibacter longurius]